MSTIILDEYVTVTKAIDNIHNKINEYKTYIENEIKNANTKKRKQKILRRFRKTLNKIKNDPDVTNKYKSLKEKQLKIKKMLIPVEKTEIDEIIASLQAKYNMLSYNNIVIDDHQENANKICANKIIHNMKFHTIINELENNLNNVDPAL